MVIYYMAPTFGNSLDVRSFTVLMSSASVFKIKLNIFWIQSTRVKKYGVIDLGHFKTYDVKSIDVLRI